MSTPTTTDTASTTSKRGEPILQVRDLSVDFYVEGEWFSAADQISYDVHAGEVLAIVGESGSGKSQSSMSLLGLLPPNGRTRGSAKMGGTELVGLTGPALRRIRGNEIAVIFQEPMTALNPVYPVGFQIVETLRTHFDMGPTRAKERAIELLELVEMPNPQVRFNSYPHQLSGGQRQRAMIAQSLACDPRLLIADEPTTALDVTVQAEILDLLRRVRTEFDTAIVLITHNMGVVADLADRVAVMDSGKIVEQGSTYEVFTAPKTGTAERFVRTVVRALPQGEELAALRAAHQGRFFTISFTDAGASEAQVFGALARAGVDFNLVHGGVDDIGGRVYGLLTIAVRGTDEAIATALAQVGPGVQVMEAAG